jgi:hypothetical protein
MPRLGILLHRAKELDEVRFEDLFASSALQIVEQRAASRDPPEVDQSRRGSDVFSR